ncbi:nucleotidyltransferase family protein [Sulfuricurvum sp.]|uniref:nucleotidyltransferase family protein n=1 Tax=Sulfuricurvum sp. TaxID=2025608 RepID=UPI0026361317|nr:nucleotidyltransferase family protein [Sulfuricurvum sp.]MDD2266773.1 nucleotidyltransferase family protein [Sulfuricurvum sp.]MDD2784046.1 nucleotidyltransferase family protein [Sulfuricurvum sp.]HZF71594.1 nucleotidyltransferase family protein [Sulfuricurvum sp.]
MPTSHQLNILVMAAGTSSRLGQPKQLLELNGHTLLWHAATQALELTPHVTVVLGHQSDQCRDSIKDLPLKTVVNANYKEGLGNSIAYGVSTLDESNCVLIMLCDQPLIPQSHYEALIQTSKENPELIIASHYGKKSGVPAVFPKQYLPSLLKLQGDKGAKVLLETNIYQYIPLTHNYSKDIDTHEDWEAVVTLYSYHI